jgi:hypothetical protein
MRVLSYTNAGAALPFDEKLGEDGAHPTGHGALFAPLGSDLFRSVQPCPCRPRSVSHVVLAFDPKVATARSTTPLSSVGAS